MPIVSYLHRRAYLNSSHAWHEFKCARRSYMDSKGCWGIEAFMKLRYSLRPQVESRREVGKILLLGRRINLNSEQ